MNRRNIANRSAICYSMAMRTEDAFPLEAEISLTDLREETSLPVALERFHRLVFDGTGRLWASSSTNRNGFA